jgi:hypothetical protein
MRRLALQVRIPLHPSPRDPRGNGSKRFSPRDHQNDAFSALISRGRRIFPSGEFSLAFIWAETYSTNATGGSKASFGRVVVQKFASFSRRVH